MDNTAKIRDIITALQNMSGLNSFEEVRQQILAKGGSVPSNGTFFNVADAINHVSSWDSNLVPANINPGISIFGVVGASTRKQWATSSMMFTSSGILTVTGIGFKPGIILILLDSVACIYWNTLSTTSLKGVYTYFQKSFDANNYVNSNGFQFDLSGLGNNDGKPCTWIAIAQ